MHQDSYKSSSSFSTKNPKDIDPESPKFSERFADSSVSGFIIKTPEGSKFRPIGKARPNTISPQNSFKTVNRSDDLFLHLPSGPNKRGKLDKSGTMNQDLESPSFPDISASQREFPISSPSLDRVFRLQKTQSNPNQQENQIDKQQENKQDGNEKQQENDLGINDSHEVKRKTFRKQRKRSSTKKNTQRVQYFGADQDQDPLRIRESDIIFKYKQFFEFLFYHLVFFFGIGPLSFLILYPLAGKLLTKNMGFAGINTMFINQSIQWGLLFSSVFLWIYADHGHISSVEVYMIVSAVFLRICTISSKYGSMHPVRIKVLKTRYLTYEELTQDYMLMKWRDQTEDVIEQELVAAIKRHDIDTSLFFLNFMAEVDEDTRKRLTATGSDVVEATKKIIATEFLRGQTNEEPKLDGSLTPKKEEEEEDINLEKQEGGVEIKSYTFIPSRASHIAFTKAEIQSDESITDAKLMAPSILRNQNRKKSLVKKKKQNLLSATLNNLKVFDMFSGINLAREILYEAKKRSIPQILVISLGIGLLRGLIPLFYRIATEKPPVGETAVQVYMAVSYIICNMYFFGANLAFVLVGLSDLQKKYYLMTQLSNLLSARKMEQYESKKKYPTINIFDPFSLRSWISLRKIFMDFGRKYFLRINLNISIFLAFYFIILTILLLKFFGIMTIIQDDLLSFVFLFEVLLMFGLMIKSIIMGAWINDHFRVHKSILQKNKTVATDLLQLDDIYFPVVENNFKPANRLYQEGVRKIKALVKLAGFEENSKEGARAIEDYLNKLVEFNDNAIEELEFDSVSNPVKILGFVTNNDLVSQIFMGLFSVGVAIVQKIVE